MANNPTRRIVITPADERSQSTALSFFDIYFAIRQPRAGSDRRSPRRLRMDVFGEPIGPQFVADALRFSLAIHHGTGVGELITGAKIVQKASDLLVVGACLALA